MSASLLAGKTLLKQDGTVVRADEVLLKKDIVALYFAAHWCPDCTAFTPTVKKFYESLLRELENCFLCSVQDVRAKNPDKLEIIFVSSDKSENEQIAYHRNDMPDWLRVPFNDKRTRATLKKEYGVCAKKEMEDIGISDSQRKAGIPTLVVLSKNRRTVKVFDAGADIEKYGEAAVDRW
ncbi:thioredoxin, putative [Perkinsus marinus ATCC 50983]|uniref:Thioredoxin, putative n=1 Tax=Perkinsus marinus (strain ATCC 50983 / TXsc) TaxID=423536 RepID=C5L4D1_PERM5|nr:thioredoxin, putative [Perkinsus marinus ATCC 50983]EER08368.1 thioredoxin, putative [Perkinsus marinus ATCC 50983]|eukprot:XP_002776552.1 thioredoxin, putative [Perkinsus marinus ATCC 50983]